MRLSLQNETHKTLFYILIAFSFSVAMRLIWVAHFSGYEPFYFNGQFMINTNDGYYWAEGARDLLFGTATNPNATEYFDKLHQPFDLSPVDTAAAQLTAFFAKILPFSFESIIFYMPVFLSSLVVIPIVLIAKTLKNLEMGLIAALLASIAWSYYNRTMAGYYDTDMLNIVLPMFLLWSLIWALQTQKDIYLFITAVDILIYRWWYPQSYALESSFFGLILLYTLIFDRKNLFSYKLLTIMMFAMMNIDGVYRFGAVVVVYAVFVSKKAEKYIFYIFALSVVAYFFSGGFNPIFGKLKAYVFKDSVKTMEEGLKLHFFTVMQTVREAGKIPFETFANRISGNTITFIVSLGGYLYLAYKHRVMLLALPMVGLGFLAYVGGLRFTIYAVPILAFGIAYLIVEIARIMPTQKLKVLSMVAFALMILYPNYKHIEAYKVPTVFSADEVKVLDGLHHIASREDYVVSWWDYGYPIRYYADVKTLIDGGKHNGSVNFPVSFLLTHPQDVAAKMARLDVEYTEKSFVFKEKYKQEIKDKNITLFSTIEQMTKDAGFDDTNDFLLSLESGDMVLPQKTRDIYLYLPYRMLDILPTVVLFSNLDLMSGKQGKQPFMFVSHRAKESKSSLDLGRGVVLDKKTMVLHIGESKVKIKRLITTAYNKKMELEKKIQVIDPKSNISLIYMSNYNTFVVLDETLYNSTYIQLMILENYDAKLYEPVILTPRVKVYKLKI